MSKRISLQVKKKPECSDQNSVQNSSLSISDNIRDKARNILEEQLSESFTEEELTELEHHVHGAAIQDMCKRGITDRLDHRFQKTYDRILSTMCLHLNPESYIKNTFLQPAVKAGSLALSDLPYMNIVDLNPVAWDKQLQTRHAEAQLVTEGHTNVATTTLIKCHKCGSGVKYNEVQTRSADEAMTIKAECIKCGFRFNI